MLEDGAEQRLDVLALDADLLAHPACLGVGVEDGEADLVLVGVEVEEELFDLVHHLGDAGVGPVDLVDDQDHRQAGLERSCAARSAVWGSGPSDASTRSRTPSTMFSPRSTSPPKSAWPGVSTMLNFTPSQRTAVFLARMVMPFSLSRSPESMTRSVSSWLARNAPVWRRRASTRVVLPWSTWATMATFRMSSRLFMGEPTIEDGCGVPYGGPQAAGRNAAPEPASTWRDRLGGQGQDGRFGLEPDPVPRVGPPTHHPPGAVALGVAQRLDQGDERELGPDRGPTRPRQHHQAAAPGAHLGPAAHGQQGRVGAVPPAVPADHHPGADGPPVEGTPDSCRPGHRLGAHGGPPGRGQPGQPAVEARDRRAAVVHQPGDLGRSDPHGVERRPGLSRHQGTQCGQAQRPAGRPRRPGEGVPLARPGAVRAQGQADLVVGDAEGTASGPSD